MTTEAIVAAYRSKPDPGHKRRDTLIERHIKMVNAIAARFVTPKHDHDDVCEFAQYQLVRAVQRAKKALTDDNIKYYIVKCVRSKLMNYVTFDHILTVPSNGNARMWKKTREDECFPKRVGLWAKQTDFVEQVRPKGVYATSHLLAKQMDVDEHVMLYDTLNHYIMGDTQKEIVELRFAGFTFREISEKTGIHPNTCINHWREYASCVQEAYNEEL